MTSHLLSWITFTPLIGALFLLCLPKRARLDRWIAPGTAIRRACYLPGVPLFRASSRFPARQRRDVDPEFNISISSEWTASVSRWYFLTALISIMACLGSRSISASKAAVRRNTISFFCSLRPANEPSLPWTFSSFTFSGKSCWCRCIFSSGSGTDRARNRGDQVLPLHSGGKSLHAAQDLAVYFGSEPRTFDMTLLASEIRACVRKSCSAFPRFRNQGADFPVHTWLPTPR